jgi:hypothetical protein
MAATAPDVAEDIPARQDPVAATDRGTPVYVLGEEIPPDLVPPQFLKRRGLGDPEPRGPFARWLNTLFPRSSAVIVRYRRYTRIFKIGKGGDVFSLTARSIRPEDRARLVAEGILNRT